MKMKNISTLFRSVFQISVTRIGLCVTFVYPVDGMNKRVKDVFATGDMCRLSAAIVC